MYIRKTNAFLLLNYVIGVFGLTLAQLVLPEKYYKDANQIKELVSSTDFLSILDGYASTAYFYKILGIGSTMPDLVAGFVSYSISFIAIAIVIKKCRWRWHVTPATIFFAWNILLIIYLGQYSKEPLALIMISLILVMAKSNFGLFISIIATLFYAIFFRLYWILVVGFFVLNILLVRMRFPLFMVLFVQISIALGIFHLGHAVTGKYLSEARVDVNLYREGQDYSVTMISNIFPNTSSFLDWANTLFCWAMLLFPFYLLTLGEFNHVIFFVFQIANIGLFLKAISYFSKKLQKGDRSLPIAFKRRIEVAISWCLAFSFVQGMFEPDFGSFARHQVVLFPMWIYILCGFYNFSSQKVDLRVSELSIS